MLAAFNVITVSLHDALPISGRARAAVMSWKLMIHGGSGAMRPDNVTAQQEELARAGLDAALDAGEAIRSEEHTSEPSHHIISYAILFLKKKTGIRVNHATKS